ncbi:hypothetical protein [Niallia oryzisoli]
MITQYADKYDLQLADAIFENLTKNASPSPPKLRVINGGKS